MTEYRYRKYYKMRFWKKRRLQQLCNEPLCAMCLAMGKAVPATVVDHVVPHKGDWNRFRLGALQSLCKVHHDGAKKRDEGKAYSSQIGPDGWPIDPEHPVYTGDLNPIGRGNDPPDSADLIG
jgi:hypothetical protein